MRIHKVLILLLFLAHSCRPNNNSTNEPGIVSKLAFFDSTLKVSNEDSVKYFYGSSQKFPFEVFNPKNSFCKLENDSLKLFLKDGIMTVSYLTLFANKDNSKVFFGKTDCTSNTRYNPIAYKLILDKEKYSIGDTLLADIFFKGVCYSDNKDFLKNDTITVTGKLKLKIRDASFTHDNLLEETNLSEFYELLDKNPDTIGKLSLRKCGLTQLPKELHQFKQLRELSLEDNTLTNADFSILTEFKELKSLNLQNCMLDKIPAQIFHLRELEFLNLYWNNLSEIPDDLYKLTFLKELNIGFNNLHFLSPKISKLINLESLETSHTEIRTYPETMSNLRKLKEIFPSDTMKYIPASLKKYAWGCDFIN